MPFCRDRLLRLLPWLGLILLAGGLLLTPLLHSLPGGRFAELLILAVLTCGMAQLLRRLHAMSMASALAWIWVLLLVVFAGVVPVLACVLLLLAATAIGQKLWPRSPALLQSMLGLLLFAAVSGWLVLLPVHYRWGYVPLFAALVIWRRSALLVTIRVSMDRWHAAVAPTPRTAAFAVALAGLASTGCWLPTLQYDDLSYHLRLPWQLMELGAYQPAPEQQVWALAPWATDVVQAVVQVMAGAEARGPVNGFWLVILASGAWQLAAQLAAGPQLRWIAAAMVSSLPLTAGLAGGMQTELPMAAVLLWMCVLAAGTPDARPSFWLMLGVLAGGILAMKTTGGLIALPVLVWALVRHPWPKPSGIGLVMLAGLAVGGASYAHAAWIAGNPVLPLFNSVFLSPFYPPVDFLDRRFTIGFSLDLPWQLTFHTSRYFESYDGAAGVVLVALAGLWLLALVNRPTRIAAVVAMAVFVLPLLPLQYLRYGYPGMVLLCVAAVAALGQRPPARSALLLLIGVCTFNIAFQAHGNWMLRFGAVKQTVLNVGRDAPLFERYAPERSLATSIRASGDAAGAVMLLDSRDAFIAEFGVRGRTTSWYSPSVQAAADMAAKDQSGRAWARLLRDQQAQHVIVRMETATPEQQVALKLTGAVLREEVNGRQWWWLPEEPRLQAVP